MPCMGPNCYCLIACGLYFSCTSHTIVFVLRLKIMIILPQACALGPIYVLRFLERCPREWLTRLVMQPWTGSDYHITRVINGIIWRNLTKAGSLPTEHCRPVVRRPDGVTLVPWENALHGSRLLLIPAAES